MSFNGTNPAYCTSLHETGFYFTIVIKIELQEEFFFPSESFKLRLARREVITGQMRRVHLISQQGSSYVLHMGASILFPLIRYAIKSHLS